MLDLTKLAQQMQGISQHLTQEAEASKRRLDIAEALMQEALQQQEVLVQQRQQWRDRMGFTAAEPIEPLDTRINVPVVPTAHTVVATDGSQIAPNHHEIAYCYLLNVGRVVLHYGQGRQPMLDSLPEVFYRPEDLYVSRQWGIRTEEWMGYCRTVSESVALAELVEWSLSATTPHTPHASPLTPHSSSHQIPLFPTPPTLAMVDGSLIYWFLESLPQDACDRILPPILAAWSKLQALRVPLVGYLSASRSGEMLNFLRLKRCPYANPDCMTHCPGQTDQAPCQVFDPLRDVALWARLLSPGQRSPLWKSSARILEQYGAHAIYFCYVHVGPEVARIEMPEWVALDAELLDTALSLSLAQVHKGFGYPVALAEAHNQAVVRGGDRTRFFALLEREMLRAGLQNIGTSYKEARKRGSIA
ncbi:MAG: DNA double-strand break repair nuclease NurA [Thainema sp.]